MNVKSQATIFYAYAMGNIKIKSITTSNVVNTQVRTVGLVAKKVANSEFFKPLDVITYHLIIHNPGNSPANDVVINEELAHQKLIENSIRYSLLDNGKINVKIKETNKNLLFQIEELKGGSVLVISYQVEVEDLEDVSIGLKNSANIYSKEVPQLTTDKLDLIQKYAKLECEKKAVGYTFLNSDINYQLLIKNKGNTEALDVEVVDQLPYTFELSKTPDAITVNNENVDIFAFDPESHILKLIVEKINPNSEVEIIIRGKIVK